MKIAKSVAFTLYVIIIFVTTFFLFTFNQFSSSQIGNLTITGLPNKIDNLSKGSLLIVKKDISEVKKGDKIIFYNTDKGKNNIDITDVERTMKTNDKEYTYVINDGLFLSSEFLIGKQTDAITIPVLGYLYLLLTSKLGYFLLIMLPIMIVFILIIKKYKGIEKHAKN